jgi:RimJ/RimL family protein N-acetyltransferase
MYVLDAQPEGLGLRRCVWQCNAANEASRRAASRMGFAFEGVQRFQRVVPKGKIGNGVEMEGTLGESRDSAVFAHYCDRWPQERGRVLDVMERR